MYLFVDNQNALRALSGGPTSNQEYIARSLEGVKVMHHRGCKIIRKWTPSHMNIMGNDHADTLAKAGLSMEQCPWSMSTLTWAKYQQRRILFQQCNNTAPRPDSLSRKPFEPTQRIPWNAAAPITRLRACLTPLDPNALREAPHCPCNRQPNSARHTLIECPLWADERKFLPNGKPAIWDNITHPNIGPKTLLQFMKVFGMTQRP